jgi:chemotaxis protein methyltransferase CheR
MGARDFDVAPLADALSETGREYPFTGADFERVRRLIYRCAGINLNPTKQHMVYSRLSRRLRALSIDSFAGYLDRLENDGNFGERERQQFVNALTTNLTSFFREAHHFETLAEFLPGCTNPRVWCAAASTGEEPYSILMTLVETLGPGTSARLMATDIDTNVLEVAKSGIYSLEAARACGEERLRRFFHRGAGANAGKVRVKPELAKMVEFTPLNLLDESWPRLRQFASTLDVVFCRNVMIYFDKSTQRTILGRIAEVLRPGGLLLVGHSENFTDCRASFALRGKTVYQRV